MTNFQKILAGVALVLLFALIFEWQSVRKAEAGPAKLVHDINDHAFGGAPREDLEPWLARRGGDVSFEEKPGPGHSTGVDHVIFRNIRHIGDSIQNLKGDFYYDAGGHLVYYELHRAWEKPKH